MKHFSVRKQRFYKALEKHDQRIIKTVASVTFAFIVFGMVMFFWSLCYDTGGKCGPIPGWAIAVMLSSLVYCIVMFFTAMVIDIFRPKGG